jgi:hypothetical protein
MLKKTCDNCVNLILEPWDYPCNECESKSKWEPCFGCRIVEDVPSSVNHPSHYNKGKIEVIDFIADQKLNFARGNAVKYVCRAGSKDPEKEIQDLEKAIWYINHEIKMLKGETNNGTEKET